MRRDRLTFAMMVGIPIMQLILFGYAINTDPTHLPTAVVLGDNGDLRALDRARAREHRLFPRRRLARTARDEAERDARAAARSSSSSTSRPISAAACSAASGRRSWSRPTPPIRSPPATPWRALSRAQPDRADARSHRAAARSCSRAIRRSSCASTAATTRKGSPSTTSCPGLIGTILTMTLVMMTGARRHPRARARHHGEPAGDAGAPARGDARQDHPVHRSSASSRSA